MTRPLLFLVLVACGDVRTPNAPDAPHADARELDAPQPDAGLCTTSDPHEQCRQIMLPRCDAFEQCFPGDHTAKAQCILDVENVCSATHLLMNIIDCVQCNRSWHDMVGMTPIPASCKTTATENCSQCYGLASTNATCPEVVPQ